MSALDLSDSGPSPSDGSDAPIEIRLFGPMEVKVAGRPLPRLRSRKGLWLLAVLALRTGRAVDRTWLSGLLWPECDETHGRRSLRQSLHDLRLALGPEAWRLGCEGSRALRLDLTGAVADVHEYDRLASGDRPQTAAAVRLYRGPLLEDCAEEWVLEERARREEAHLANLAGLASSATADDDHEAAAAYLRQALGVDPFREDLLRRLMTALDRAGNTAAGLQAYRQLCELLRREGLEPDSETVRLYRALTERTAAASEASPLPSLFTPVPAPITPLIGREAEVGEILERLRTHRLITLTGAAGTGKTRVAMAVAALADGDCPDGVFWMDARALDTEGAAGLAGSLRSKRVLLVLDGCDTLPDDRRPGLAEILAMCPGVRLLATTRAALGLSGEYLYPLAGLPVPPPHLLGTTPAPADLLRFASVQLFAELASAADRSFALTRENAVMVTRVCRNLDGVPLALELAAARLRASSLDELARSTHPLFAAGSAETPRALGTALEPAWRRLTPAERLLLQRLAVFRGEWSRESAAQVCRGDGLRDAELPALLASLLDKSWLSFGRDRSERYRLNEPARTYAALQLRQSHEHQDTSARHGRYFLHWAETAKACLWGTEQALWFERLEAEHDNLRAALEWFRESGDSESELRLLVAVARFWDTHGHLREGRERLDRAVGEMSEGLPRVLRLAALAHSGWMAYAAGDYRSARKSYARALGLARESGCPFSSGQVLNLSALVALEEGQCEEARSLLYGALEAFGGGSEGRKGSVLNNLGTLSLRVREYEAARAFLEESAAWAEKVGDAQAYALAIGDLAAAEGRHGRWREAGTHAAAGLRLLFDCGDLSNLPRGLDGMAEVAQALEQWVGATRLRASAHRLRVEGGLTPAPAIRSAGLASAAQHRLGSNDYARAWDEGRAMSASEAVDYALTQIHF